MNFHDKKRRFGGFIRNVLLSLILLLPATTAKADFDLISNVALFADPTAQMEVETAAQEQFTPTSQTITLGYTTAAQWLRLRIHPAPSGEPVVLLIRPPMLDSVRVYQPILASPDGFGPALATGEYQAVERLWPSSLRGYVIAPPEGGADYFVRIGSAGSIAAHLVALPRSDAIRTSLFNDIFQICYFALMLTLLLWSLRLFSLTGERLFGWFSAMQSIWLLHNILSFGYFDILLTDVANETVITAFRTAVIMASILSIIFHRTLLIRFEPMPLAIRMFDVQLAFMCIAFVIFWTVDRTLALQINAYCIISTPFIFLFNIITARKDVSPGLSTMRTIYTVLSVFLLLWTGSLLGHNNGWMISIHGFIIHGLSTGLLMFIILNRHGQNLFAAGFEAKAEIARIEHQRAVQQEKTNTLAQFIDMLSHEARNALAVINMSIATPNITKRQRDRVGDAIRGLSGVIDRCMETVQLDAKNSQITRDSCDLLDILQQICAESIKRGRIDLRRNRPAIVQGDPVLIGVVFNNLVDNALKYSPADSMILIRIEDVSDGICITFENEEGAAGRPDPKLAFDKYYRSEGAKTQIGSGFGLYVVRGLVELHGGQVICESKNKCIRFKVFFPC